MQQNIELRFQDSMLEGPAVWFCAARNGKPCDHGKNDGACEECCIWCGELR